MHGTTLAVGDTLTATEKLADDGADSAAAHVGEAVAAVGGDDVVSLLDRVLDTDGNGLLTNGQMAETTNLLLLVQSVGGHLHLPVCESMVLAMLYHVVMRGRDRQRWGKLGALVVFGDCIPDDDHVVVHLLQLLLGDGEGIGRGVELVGLEGLIAEGDLEGLLFRLD